MSGRSNVSRKAMFGAVALLLGVALLAGGTARPFNELTILLASLPVIYLLLVRRPDAPMAWTGKLAIALLALAMLQLVPLPPAIWTSLPGRELAASALLASGNELGWRPLALNPFAALAALLTCIAPIAMHIGATRLDGGAQKRLLALVAGFALFSAVIGFLQRTTGALTIYQTEHVGAALGLFANRNHHADLLVAGILLMIALLPHKRSSAQKALATAAIALLVFAVIATTSRAGIALAAPAAVAALVAIWRPRKGLARLLVLGAIGAGIGLLFIPAFTDIFARFGIAADDQRITMARDSMVATRAMWPFGSGYGSFVPVYMAYENLDMMEARYVVAAHNDFLQLALEGGLPGVITGCAAVIAMAVMGWNILQSRASALVWAAWGVALVLLIHSAVDFPLRTGTLAVIFGLCTGIAQSGIRTLRHHANQG